MKTKTGNLLKKLKPIPTPTCNPQTQTLQTSNPDRKTNNPEPASLADEKLTSQEAHPNTKQVKMENVEAHEEKLPNFELGPRLETTDTSSKDRDDKRINLPHELIKFKEYKCPPGGKDKLVLYTTSLRGIRKTFEDCNAVRFLLESLRVAYSERDVSMHLEYRNELWGVMGARTVPPRLFVRGRYVGGADEVVGLHEKGALMGLLRGIPPMGPLGGGPCSVCGGMRFVLCVGCNGSRKVGPTGGEPVRCVECNENGLVKCSVCG
ncbi:Glutaredoxin family protein [Striga hermonthica]|uniref:Glutaredoxin family protein n=1 Tax=Striga hermonthica TaxID=68872 RepID=A0A9N7RD74_STRHE|nr:Glutaredoxin family protein [Striga hermonthica]